MDKMNSTGNAADMGATCKFLERQGRAGGGNAGAYQVEVGSVSPPGVRGSASGGVPMPRERADKPGV